jgi:NitT/TauT family transport system substrate-binding protein
MALDRRTLLTGLATSAASANFLCFTSSARGQGAEILVGVPTETVDNLPIMVAAALNYFRDEGLNVRPVMAGGGTNVRQNVVAGQFRCGMGDLVHPLAITGSGKHAKALLAIDTRASYASILVRKELWDRGIRTIEAFGKMTKPDGSKPSIGVTRIGSATWLYGDYIMTLAGLAGRVNFISVGDPGPQMGAFRSGRIDALMTNLVNYIDILDSDVGKAIFDANDGAAWDKVFGGNVPSQCTFAMADQIAAQPTIMQGVVNGIYRALKFIEKSSAETIYESFKHRYLTSSRRDMAIRSIDLMKPLLDFDGRITKEIYAAGSKLWFGESTKIAPQPYDKVVDLSFIEAAKKKYG